VRSTSMIVSALSLASVIMRARLLLIRAHIFIRSTEILSTSTNTFNGTINTSVRPLMMGAVAFNQFWEILSKSISALNGIPSNGLYGCRRYEHSIERRIST
jgi:hypothetical protein